MMAQRTVKLRRFLGARRYAGECQLPQQALARVSPARTVGSASATARSNGLGAASSASLCSIPSLLTCIG
jgi:hypothetical protein